MIAVLSHIVVDEVHPHGGGDVGIDVGGAGAYAAVGASLAVEPGAASGAGASGTGGPGVVLVSGVGRDDHRMLADWCQARLIDPAGLFEVGPVSPRTRIDYFADGERRETPVHGLAHFDAHTPLPRHLPVAPSHLDGVYLFHDHDPGYWSEIEACRGQTRAPILWEISLDSCRREALPAVLDRLAVVDLLSLNRSEALGLFGVGDLADALEALSHLPVVVALRLGAEGSVVLENGARWMVSAAPAVVVDPTGGGNSYSGALLTEFARTGDPVGAAEVAAAAASLVIGVNGAPLVDEAARRLVRTLAPGTRRRRSA
jgi:sugar/nucleoside kinase (ribokinase family)